LPKPVTEAFFIIDMANNNSFKLFSDESIKSLSEMFFPPVIVADHILSPMNIGAILRLSANIGALKTWFVYDEKPNFRPYKINRNSSGATEKTDWDYVDREKLFINLPADYKYVAVETSPDAENIYCTGLPEKIVFFVGNERYGLTDEILKKVCQKVFIPLTGSILSLNVSHALSVAMFEWFRRQIWK